MGAVLNGQEIVGGIFNGQQVFEDTGWRIHVVDNPAGVFKSHWFLYKVNKVEKYVSLYFSGEKANQDNLNDQVIFDLSWLVKGISSIDFAIPDNQLSSYGNSTVKLNISGTKIVGHGGFTTTTEHYAITVISNLVHNFGLTYDEPRVYYTELVD